MKPDWTKAPPDAEWAAMDSDGKWRWFTRKPAAYLAVTGFWDDEPRDADMASLGWTTAIEPRP